MANDDVRGAMAGDAPAFDSILAARLPATYRVAVAILGSEAEASEVVRDAWLLARHELRRGGDPAGFDGWLDRTLLDACLSASRPSGRLPETAILEELEVRRVGPQPAWSRDERVALERAFDGLTLEQRAVLVLDELESWPASRIAAAFEVPVATATSRVHGARAALNRQVATEAARQLDPPVAPTDEQLRRMLLDRATLRMPPGLRAAVLDGDRARPVRAGLGTVPATGAVRGGALAPPWLAPIAVVVLVASVLLVQIGSRRPQAAAAATAAPTVAMIPTGDPGPSSTWSPTFEFCDDFDAAARNGGFGGSYDPAPGPARPVPANGPVIVLAGSPASPATFDPLGGGRTQADQLRTWGLHTLAVDRWAGSADGSVVAADLAAPDCPNIVWVMRSDGGSLRAPFAAANQFAYGAAWSADARLAAAVGFYTPSGRNGGLLPTSVEVWDPVSGRLEDLGRPCVTCAVTPGGGAVGLRWSPDGSSLAVELIDPVCADAGTPSDGSPCALIAVVGSDRIWRMLLPGSNQPGASLELLGWLDDTTLLIDSSGSLARVDVPSRSLIPLATEPRFAAGDRMTLSPDGSKVLVLGSGVKGATLVLDVATGKRTALPGVPATVVDAAWSPDSTFVLVKIDGSAFGIDSGMYLVAADGTAPAEEVLPGVYGAMAWLAE